MTTLVKIVIGTCGAVLVGAGIYYGIKDSKVKEAEIEKQYACARNAIDQMKKEAASKMKDQVDDYLKEMDAKIDSIKRDIEEDKKHDDFRKHCERLIMETKHMTDY